MRTRLSELFETFRLSWVVALAGLGAGSILVLTTKSPGDSLNLLLLFFCVVIFSILIAARADARRTEEEAYQLRHAFTYQIKDAVSSAFELGRTGLYKLYIDGRGFAPDFEKRLEASQRHIYAVLSSDSSWLSTLLGHSKIARMTFLGAEARGLSMKFILVGDATVVSRLLSRLDLGDNARIRTLDSNVNTIGSLVVIDDEAFWATPFFSEDRGLILLFHGGDVSRYLEEQFRALWAASVSVVERN